LREEVRKFSYSGSAATRHNPAAEQGSATKPSILDDLQAPVAVAEMEAGSLLSGEDEVTNYLREPHPPANSDPLAW